MTAQEGVVSVNSVKEKLQDKLKELEQYKTLVIQSSNELELEKEKNRQADIEITTLNRKINLMGDEYEQLFAKLRATNEKLEETLKVADECEKQRRALDHRRAFDEDKLLTLEQIWRETSEGAIESERKLDEASRKLVAADTELEKAEAKNEAAELKTKHFREDLHALGVKLKAMQLKVDKAGDRELKFDKTIEELRDQLKRAENHANNADKTISKLQKELDELQDELLQTRLAYQSLRDDSDSFSRQIRAN